MRPPVQAAGRAGSSDCWNRRAVCSSTSIMASRRSLPKDRSTSEYVSEPEKTRIPSGWSLMLQPAPSSARLSCMTVRTMTTRPRHHDSGLPAGCGCRRRRCSAARPQSTRAPAEVGIHRRARRAAGNVCCGPAHREYQLELPNPPERTEAPGAPVVLHEHESRYRQEVEADRSNVVPIPFRTAAPECAWTRVPRASAARTGTIPRRKPAAPGFCRSAESPRAASGRARW